MKNISIWRDKKVNLEPFLDENIETDILIIGGGITGLSTAYFLRDKGYKVCLTEKNYIGNGVTTKSTGKITYLQDILKDIDNIDDYIKAQIEACNLIKKVIMENNIDCDYEEVYHYLDSDDNRKINDLYKKIKNYCKRDGNTLKALSAVFNPFKFLISLKEICLKSNVKIYENTGIIKVDTDRLVAYTGKYKIKFKNCVLATHYPSLVKLLFLPVHSYLEKSYLGATKVFDNKKSSGISIDKDSRSYRYYKDYHIFLGEVSDTSMNFNISLDFDNLIKRNITADYVWSNKDIMTIDHMPYIGKVLDNIYIGTGYNTWGMTNGFLAGKIISDLILKGISEFGDLFDPKRLTKLKDYLKFPIFMGISAKAFVKSRLDDNPYKLVALKKINNKKVLIYTDKDGRKHMVCRTCPHLKCGIILNKVEEIWECPCHGSKFDIDGKCIEGPSNFDISFKENS